jgi:hypothetical protein
MVSQELTTVYAARFFHRMLTPSQASTTARGIGLEPVRGQKGGHKRRHYGRNVGAPLGPSKTDVNALMMGARLFGAPPGETHHGGAPWAEPA